MITFKPKYLIKSINQSIKIKSKKMDENRITKIGYYRNVVNQLIQIQLYKEHNYEYEHKISELKESFLNFSRSFNIDISEESIKSYTEINIDNIFSAIHHLSWVMHYEMITTSYLAKLLLKIEEFINEL